MAATRDVAFPSGPLTLEGVLHLPGVVPAPAAAVCHPHPAYGGDMHSYVVTTICEALSSAGIVSLRFNFRGVGRSEGQHEGGQGEGEDVRAALEWLRSLPEVERNRLALAGYSFGALVAAAGGGFIRALALVSPPAADLSLDAVASHTPVLVVTGEDDFVAPPPLLREAIGVRPGVELRVLQGEDHFWSRRLDEMASLVAEFVARASAG